MAIKAKPTFSLKDQLFNADSVRKLADRLATAHADFDGRAYANDVVARFPQLELKQRIDWMVTTLESHLPAEFGEAREILLRALPEPLDPDKTDDDFGEFIWVVPGEYVARHGCTPEYRDESLDFLREATKRFSSEGAIRPFLREFPDETLAFVKDCAVDDNYHVRRLASEGIRPFLPWAERVVLDTADIIGVLDTLHADHTRYVTRSVANNLNDVSKIDPDVVVDTLGRWRKLERQEAQELGWMTRHALRTLAKTEHSPTLKLLGYATKPKIRINDIETSDRVRLGEAFTWQCTLTSLAAQKLKIGLRLHFLKANGGHSTKVFAIADKALGKGESIEIRKAQAFKPITTRTLYPGIHYAELLVNGKPLEKRSFEFMG